MLPASELPITSVSPSDPDFAPIFPYARPGGRETDLCRARLRVKIEATLVEA